MLLRISWIFRTAILRSSSLLGSGSNLPLDAGRKLNAHETFRAHSEDPCRNAGNLIERTLRHWCSGHHLNVSRTFNLRSVPTAILYWGVFPGSSCFKILETHTKIFAKLYCFRETKYFLWKFEDFDELQLPYNSTFFPKTLYTFSTYQYLQKGVWEFFFILLRS